MENVEAKALVQRWFGDDGNNEDILKDSESRDGRHFENIKKRIKKNPELAVKRLSVTKYDEDESGTILKGGKSKASLQSKEESIQKNIEVENNHGVMKKKRTKTRSRQKNIRKDKREENLKPHHLQLSSNAYTGRSITEVRSKN